MKIHDLIDTPNPDARRFVLDANVVPVFANVSARKGTTPDHALAKDLLDIDGVVEIFLQGSWVTITREPNVPWDTLSRRVAVTLRQYQPQNEAGFERGTDGLPDEDPRSDRIRQVIQQAVAPYLNSHGGSLRLVALEGSTLFVQYQGACSGCPASMTGTLMGVESLLQKEVDPALTVTAI